MRIWLAAALVALGVLARAADPPALTGSHATLACTACHGDAGTADCGRCHRAEAIPHPIGVTAPREMPSRFAASPEGRLLCRTCHRLHGGQKEQSYLQPPLSGTYASRKVFCAECHRQGMAANSPHRGARGENRCLDCHIALPQSPEAALAALRAPTSKLCRFCHGLEVEDHVTATGSYGPIPRQLPLGPDGSPTCSTCHDPHAATASTHQLRRPYALAFGRSLRENPHVESYFACRACHKTGFAEQICPPTCELLYQGDRVLLCLSCHVTEQAHHPTGILLPNPMRQRMDASELKVPLDARGRITCTTCHDNGCASGRQRIQERHYDKTTLRNDLCWICHERREFARIIPHSDDPALCSSCHENVPVRGSNGRGTAVASATMICLLCHEPKPHPANAPHVVVPPENLRPESTLPLGRRGEITCATCHDPHMQAVPLPKRLRERGERICSLCHWR